MYNTNVNELYLAFDRKEQQKVVIKARSQNASGDRKRCEMFAREIRIAFSLDHPCILRPIEEGEEILLHETHPVPFIVYPFIKRGSLEAFLSDQPSWIRWPLIQVAKVILQAGSALMYMHQQRPRPIVHLDVKADNFLVQLERGSSKIDRLLLCDFGIAHSLNSQRDMAEEPRGMPTYMAPEQFNGAIMYQSDQYALAFLAHHLLTGEYPLQPDAEWTWETLQEAHTYIKPSPPSKFRPGCFSHDIDAVILKALSKDPEQRFATIWDFAYHFYYAIKEHTGDSLPENVLKELTPVSNTIVLAKPVPLHPALASDTDSLAERYGSTPVSLSESS